MFTKYSQLRGRSTEGRPLIHMVEPGSAYGTQDTSGISKTASGEHLPQVIELIESLEAQPDRLYLVNSALGAGEYVGFNLRGDWFGEEGLKRAPKGFDDIPVWDIDARRRAANQTEIVPGWGPLAWGHTTFYNAHRFRHHVNKDPNKAYGYILGAFWDDRMKRVILVSELIESMCANLGAQHIYDRIKAGEFPDSSMGSKVPYDACSICGHKARSPAQYCEHVSSDARPPYGMKSLLPDGRVCGVYNDYPRFFDDSFVFIGAERSAKVMSDVTDKIKGTHSYSQTLYPFVRTVAKVASAPEQKAVQGVKDVVIPDFVLEEKLTRAVQQIQANTPLEREALRYFMQERLGQERIARGTMSGSEYEMWKQISTNLFLRQYGVPPENLSYLRQLFNSKVEQMTGMQKSAEMPKWAEMLKRIPAPSPKQLSLVRSEEQSMPELPREILEVLAKNPRENLVAAARMGVVLKPREFQHVILHKKNPEIADNIYSKKVVFRPCPLKENTSAFGTSYAPKEVMRTVAGLLSRFLERRSFAPTAVRIRILKGNTEPTSSTDLLEKVSDLEEISELYNVYRLGLIQNPPDMRAINLNFFPSETIKRDEKVAEDSVSLSNLLLHVAYWPGLSLGLGQLEEGVSPEDAANTPENVFGENHVSTP